MIYADNAATTPLAPSVLEAMLPFFTQRFGNPSSLHAPGREAKRAVCEARAEIAALLGALPEEIFFTSGGSEADNWAVKGIARAGAEVGKRHIVTTQFEHPAVLEAVRALEREGFAATYLPVHEEGVVRREEFRSALREDTCLATVMAANNEVGAIQPVTALSADCRERGIPFHTDAVQAAGILPINVKKEGFGLLSLSGHKLHGPKGIGLLYIEKGLRPRCLIEGGGQESGLRAGTENVPAIVGLCAALREACARREQNAARILSLRRRLEEGLLSRIPHARVNAADTPRLPGHLSLCLPGAESEPLLLLLERAGICVSSGSACSSLSREPNHALLALGLAPELARCTLRITLGDLNTDEEVEQILSVLPPLVAQLRAMTPAGERYLA